MKLTCLINIWALDLISALVAVMEAYALTVDVTVVLAGLADNARSPYMTGSFRKSYMLIAFCLIILHLIKSGPLLHRVFSRLLAVETL